MTFSERILGVDTSELKEVLSLIKGGEVISFAGGVPSKEVFPLKSSGRFYLRSRALRMPSSMAPPWGLRVFEKSF